MILKDLLMISVIPRVHMKRVTSIGRLQIICLKTNKESFHFPKDILMSDMSF